MELTTMQMYWIAILDNIKVVAITISVLSGILSFPLVFEWIDEQIHGITPLLSLFMAVLGFAAFAFLPSTKQMAAIMIVPKIVNCEKVQSIGNKVYDLAVEWMDELKPNKKEGAK